MNAKAMNPKISGIRGEQTNGKSPRRATVASCFLRICHVERLFDREHGLSSRNATKTQSGRRECFPCVREVRWNGSRGRLANSRVVESRWIQPRGRGDRFASARQFTHRDSPSRKAEHYCDMKESRFKASRALRNLR